MRVQRTISEANIYHVMGRGVGGQIIFEDDEDYGKMLELMGQTLAKEGDVLAWCLMDNHFHILVELEMPDLSAAMRRMLSSYASFFNQRHGRNGHLFQDRFASEAVGTEEYLLTVVRYIHRNPIKAGITKTCEYRWSSYGAYVSPGPDKGMCSAQRVLGLFGSTESFEEFHLQGDNDACLDVSTVRRRVSDDKALAVARGILGDNPASGIAALDRKARDEALRHLRGKGLTIRQIQRLTGVGRGVIQRA